MTRMNSQMYQEQSINFFWTFSQLFFLNFAGTFWDTFTQDALIWEPIDLDHLEYSHAKKWLKNGNQRNNPKKIKSIYDNFSILFLLEASTHLTSQSHTLGKFPSSNFSLIKHPAVSTNYDQFFSNNLTTDKSTRTERALFAKSFSHI